MVLSKYSPVSALVVMAPSSQLSQRPCTTSTNSAADYTGGVVHAAAVPKFPAASGIAVVTTFQPARPPLSLSSDAERPRDVERRRIRGRGGGDEAHSRCLSGERGVQGERLEPEHLARVLLRYERETVADEQEVEFPSFAESAIVLKIEKSSLLVAAPGTRQPDT